MRRPIYCLLLALFGYFTSLNAQTTWTGGVDSDWFNAGNWSSGLPVSGNDAIIPNGFAPDIVLTSSLVFDFNITNDGILEVFLSDYDLEVSGNILNDVNGMMIFNGGADGVFYNSGSYANNGSTVVNACTKFAGNDGSFVFGAGFFTNNGIVYELGAALVTITGGSGVVLTDISDEPSPTASCVPTITIQLDNNDEASLNANDLDDGSSADYCSIASLDLFQEDYNCNDVGSSQILLEVEDALGNISTCTTEVIVQDTVPPSINCPTLIEIDLDPGDCDVVVEFDFLISASDNCGSPAISQFDNTGLSSGDAFPIGCTWLIFEADDGYNQDQCVFKVDIKEFIPSSAGLVCNDQINVSLSPNCDEILTPDHILEGEYGCWDDFEVIIEETGSNYITVDHLGENVTVHVTSLETGNTCWGKALIEEKLPPEVYNCDSLWLSCVHNPLPDYDGGDAPSPEFWDCSGVDLYYYEDLDMVNGGCDEDFMMLFTRKWTIIDNVGNGTTCEQVITVEKLSLADDDPICPPDYSVECEEGVSPDFDPEITGYPMFPFYGENVTIKDNPASACTITATYSDVTIPKCGAGYRILRTWLVADWCLPMDMVVNPWTCKQIIDYTDHTAPDLFPPDDFTVHPDANCKAFPVIPPATIADCSEVTVVTHTPIGPIMGNGGAVPFPGLGLGTHEIRYKATDACGNFSEEIIYITVEDNLPPYMICIEHTVVSVTNDGTAVSYATSYDEGSYDNCTPIHLQVRRMDDYCFADTAFQDYIRFCCEDIGFTRMVVLRATDWFGNWNECMIEVKVQDKLLPYFECPADITIDCGEDYEDLDSTGDVVTDPADQDGNDGLATDNCPNLDISYTDVVDVDCGEGTVLRTWTVTDMGDNTLECTQTITLESANPYDGSDIIWPGDATVGNCGLNVDPSVTGEPVIPTNTICTNLFVGYDDDELVASQDGCLKILRHWEVIDWCQYVANSGSDDGRWLYTQTIKVLDDDAPFFDNCDDITFCNFKSDCGPLGLDLSVSVSDVCSPDSDIELTWEVDENDDGSVDATGDGQHLGGDYYIGTHRITYYANDGCGNMGTCSFLFTINDCKKPTVVCKQLIVEIMQTGEITVMAEQFKESGTSDNCTAEDDLVYSFSALVFDDELTLTCDNIGDNSLEMWVTDQAGNQDFCTTNLIVQDNMGACSVDTLVVNLGGQISNWESESVENVSIELSGSQSVVAQTDIGGVYHFDNIYGGFDYTITPSFNESHSNGVSTFDLVLLSRHILGIQTLDSPYKLIAADANNTGTLTVSDMVEVRKIVLHINEVFPSNNSWRFVESGYVFPDPANPFSPIFPELTNVNNLTDDMMTGNFTAIKIGDLNGNALTNSLQSSEDRDFDENFVITSDNQSFKTGELVAITITADDLKDILGFQFTLNFDQNYLEFQNIEPIQETSSDNFGLALLEEGAITASWDNSTNTLTEHSTATTLFNLTFEAIADGNLSEVLNINSRFTNAEAYDLNGELMNVSLQFNEENGAVVAIEPFALYQNIPNPFRDETVIGFNLPDATTVTLSIFDASGKNLQVIKSEGTKGYNQIAVKQSDLGGNGIFYYQLETPTHTATKMMTKIE